MAIAISGSLLVLWVTELHFTPQIVSVGEIWGIRTFDCFSVLLLELLANVHWQVGERQEFQLVLLSVTPCKLQGACLGHWRRIVGIASVHQLRTTETSLQYRPPTMNAAD